MTEQKKEFTGVWIPRAIVEDDRLNWVERACYAEIACYVKCFASNAFLCKRLDVSERTLQRIISHLKELEYIEQSGFDGRFRVLVACTTWRGRGDKNGGSAPAEMAPIDNSIEKSKDITADADLSFKEVKVDEFGESVEKPVKVKSDGYGYDEMIKWMENQTGVKIKAKGKQYAALKLARENKIGRERLKARLVDLMTKQFYQENGIDWGMVVSSFDRKS